MTSDEKSMEELHELTGEEHPQGKRPFGNYDLVRRIDMGGMGEVYLAQQRSAFNREVAIKIIREDLSSDSLARARFFREAEVSSYLKHEHILPLFEFGEVDNKLFFVTPYISGGTLAQRLSSGPLPLDEAQRLFTALVQAVAYIHRRGVVHRDLKPSNILLDDEESSEQVYVRLIDFGIATKPGAAATAPLTTAGHEMGTIAYMAPERLNGIAAASNDIYSLGVILYQMLTGNLPGEGSRASRALPAVLEAVVQRCTAANPGDRYSSAAEVLHGFVQACQALHTAASGSLVLPSLAGMALQPVEAENVAGVPISAMVQHRGNTPAPRKDGAFGQEDYFEPTMDIVRAQMSKGRGAKSRKKKNLAASVSDATVIVPGGKKFRGPGRQKPVFLVVSLLMVIVLSVMAGMIFLVIPQAASASVSIGPQVHALQQVYTITARPSQTGIDLADSSIPASMEVLSQTASQTGQTGGQQCSFFVFRCRQVVSSGDVENLSYQLRQSLIPQLSAAMDSQLQTLHATVIGSKQYTDLAISSIPAIGTQSNTVTVTLTEQASVEYVSSANVQQLARQLLAKDLEPNTALVNSTIQIGQPVVLGVTDPGVVTIKVAAAGVAEYQYSAVQLQAIQNHIEGMTLTDAQAYLQHLPGVDASTIAISIHSLFGEGSTLPSSASQIKIISVAPSSLPTTTLPVIAAPETTPDNGTPTM